MKKLYSIIFVLSALLLSSCSNKVNLDGDYRISNIVGVNQTGYEAKSFNLWVEGSDNKIVYDAVRAQNPATIVLDVSQNDSMYVLLKNRYTTTGFDSIQCEDYPKGRCFFTRDIELHLHSVSDIRGSEIGGKYRQKITPLQ